MIKMIKGFAKDITGKELSPWTSSETVIHNGEPMSQILSRIVSSAGIQGNVGEIFWWPLSTPPDDSLYCDGSAVSREDYADLFAVIGIQFGNGDGSTTFNLPDMRGEFVRGYDPTNARDPEVSRDVGSHQEATAIKPVTENSLSVMLINPDKLIPSSGMHASAVNAYNNSEPYYRVRPTNISMLPCIRYKVKTLPWCEGIIQNRSLTASTYTTLTPLVPTAGNIEMVSGNKFVALERGLYILNTYTGMTIATGIQGTIICKNVQTYDIAKTVASNFVSSLTHRPSTMALNWLEVGEYLIVVGYSNVAQSSISNIAQPCYTFARIA